MPFKATDIGNGRVSIMTPEGIEITFYLDPKEKKPLELGRTNYEGEECMRVSKRSYSKAIRMAAGIFRDPRKAEALRNP